MVVRRQPLTGTQVTQVKRLYRSGLSLSEVAEQMSINQETMRIAIIAAGVKLRPPTGAGDEAHPVTIGSTTIARRGSFVPR